MNELTSEYYDLEGRMMYKWKNQTCKSDDIVQYAHNTSDSEQGELFPAFLKLLLHKKEQLRKHEVIRDSLLLVLVQHLILPRDIEISLTHLSGSSSSLTSCEMHC